MSLLVLLVLGYLAAVNYRICRDVRYPPFIMSVLWLLTMTIYFVAPIDVEQVGVVTVLIFIATIVAFSGGALLALDLRGGSQGVHTVEWTGPVRPAAHPRLKIIFLALSAVALPLTIEKAYQIVSQSGYDIFFIGLRLELEGNDSTGYGLLGYAAVLSFFTTFLYAIEPRTAVTDKLLSYLSFAISLAFAILSTGRTTIFFILAVLAGIALMQRRFSMKTFVVSVLAFLLSFGLIAIATLKGGNPDAPWSENVSSIGESLLIYGVGPLPAFDHVVRAAEPLSYGQNTFLGPLNVARRFAGKARLSPIQDEVDVPFPVNVYTAIHPVYKDFGVIGVVLAFGMLGGVSTYFYLRGLTGDRLFTFYYALALFPLLFMTFSDQYFAPMLTWIMYGSASYMYFRNLERPQQSVDILREA